MAYTRRGFAQNFWVVKTVGCDSVGMGGILISTFECSSMLNNKSWSWNTVKQSILLRMIMTFESS